MRLKLDNGSNAFSWRTVGSRAKQALFELRHNIRLAQANRAIENFRLLGSRDHRLPSELIVSLTSYPPRYETLSKTLKSLLMQTMRPDRTVLWIAQGDEAGLPKDVLDLTRWGLEIRRCSDVGSYKKIVPALKLFGNAHIVTADDDLYYEPRWLETLVTGVVPGEKVIICRRAHRPTYHRGRLAPYSTWEHDIITDGAVERCIFPTTGAGVLFPPGSLARESVDERCFLELCPTADDVWLFAMALRAGARFRQVGGGFAQIAWAGSQSVSLMGANLNGGNDRQLASVISHFLIDCGSFA